MSAALVLAAYNEHPISFNTEGWFDATGAAALWKKLPNEWLRLPTTAEYLGALQRKYGNFPHLTTRRGAGGGTWMHPRLAVPFARWLDVDFAVWCDSQIDLLLRGASDWKRMRHEAAASYKVMQQILQISRADAGKVSAPHHFSNEARLVNFALTGEFKGLVRDNLALADLTLLARLEERNAVLIARNVEYGERKLLVEQYALDLRDALVSRLAQTTHPPPAAAAKDEAETLGPVSASRSKTLCKEI